MSFDFFFCKREEKGRKLVLLDFTRIEKCEASYECEEKTAKGVLSSLCREILKMVFPTPPSATERRPAIKPW